MITGRRHRATLRQALRAQLELKRCMTEEAPKLVGSEQQIERARLSAREIEQFLLDLRAATGGKRNGNRLCAAGDPLQATAGRTTTEIRWMLLCC